VTSDRPVKHKLLPLTSVNLTHECGVLVAIRAIFPGFDIRAQKSVALTLENGESSPQRQRFTTTRVNLP
jgi:hypothetical protein